MEHAAPSLPANTAQEARLPSALVSAASAYIAAARAPSTRKAYARAWAAFAGWCERHGRTALPASLETVAAWMADLATAGRRQRRSTRTLPPSWSRTEPPVTRLIARAPFSPTCGTASATMPPMPSAKPGPSPRPICARS